MKVETAYDDSQQSLPSVSYLPGHQ
jgi:hypothetical protein